METKLPTPDKITFRDIVKHPLVYALVVITSLLWIFVFNYSQSHGDTISAKDSEIIRLTEHIEQLESQLVIERAERDNLYKALLVKNGIITEMVVRIDSLNNRDYE